MCDHQIDSLRKFLTLLDSRQELLRIKDPLDPLQEIAAFTNRVCKSQNNRALLFEHPLGARFPVATNLFGSLERVRLALGLSDLNQLSHRLAYLLQQIETPVVDELDHQIASVADFSRCQPSIVGISALESQHQPDLTRFPFLQAWPEDGSSTGNPRYITLPLVFSTAPDGGTPNCGLYRAQVVGPRELAIRWRAGSGAGRHLDEFRRTGKKMPVAIALGGDPAITFAAMSPLPGNLDEVVFAGFLRGNPMQMASCRTVPLTVPVASEVVIEGYVDPEEVVIEGPFGNHTGFYSAAGPAALMRVTDINHRPDAIIPATVVGPPPMEDCFMARAWERLLLGFMRRLVPAVVEINFPLQWIFHQSAIISLENPDPAMVRETADLLWSLPWFAGSRILIFVNSEIQPSDFEHLTWQTINITEFKSDIFYDKSGLRLGLDASRSGEKRVRFDPRVEERVKRLWQQIGAD